MAQNKAGKFELTPRQKKLVKRYFPRNEKPTDGQAETTPAVNTITQEPQEDTMQETTQPKATQHEPETAEIATQQPITIQAVPDYTTAMSQITKELHAMRDAKTRDELLSAKSRCERLIERYTPYYDYQCNQKRLDVEYYVEAFDKRA